MEYIIGVEIVLICILLVIWLAEAAEERSRNSR